jgi:2-keto-4-pentenoate hydratase/2-oxohepta-3-ene-1,7-dioic acid hydratase in catechol pathway
MKLLRYGDAGQEKPGILDGNGRIRDLSAHVTDISGDMLGDEKLAAIAALDIDSLPLVEGNPRIGPCVAGVGKFLCIGLNYSDHAADGGAAGTGAVHEGDLDHRRTE